MTGRATARDLQVHDRLGKAGPVDALVDDGFPLLDAERILQLDRFEAAGQSREVLTGRKWLAVVRAHHLVHAVGELKSAVLHSNGGAFERQKLSVDVGDLGHGSVVSLSGNTTYQL
jgi:hypothetical protein